MVSDAEDNADADRKARELAEARNTAESAAYANERQLKDLGDAVDESSRTEIEAAIKEVRAVLTSDDAAEITAKTEAMQSAFHKVSEAMYEKAQAEHAEGASGDGPVADADVVEEDVVDAEVVDEGK